MAASVLERWAGFLHSHPLASEEANRGTGGGTQWR